MRKSFCVNKIDKINILKSTIETYENIMEHFQSEDYGLCILGFRIDGDRIIAAWKRDKKEVHFINYRTNEPIAIDFESLKSKELDSLLYTICALSSSAIPHIPNNPPIDKNKIYFIEDQNNLNN